MEDPGVSPWASVTASLLRSLTEMPADAGDRSGEHDLPQRPNAADVNRALMEESERDAIAEHFHGFLASRFVVLVLAGLVVTGYNLLGISLWVWGAVILAREHKQPCDQPLTGWLYGVLVWVAIDKMYCSYRYNQSLDVGRNIDQNILPTLCSVSIRSLFLGFGFWWYIRSETCAKSSPYVYACVRFYLMFNSIFVVIKVITSCAMVHWILWLARSGGGPFARPGARRAARRGLIDELATVEFQDDLFAEEGGGGAGRFPRECCVCQDDFDDEGGSIKRTPCSPIPHYFHEDCLKTWLERYGKTCPVCRTDLEKAVDGAA